MSDLEKEIIDCFKTLILPEIRKLQEGQNELRIRQDAVEKQLVMINENVLGNSRRIDELIKRIDGANKRIDDTNQRVDHVFFETGGIKQEKEHLKREDAVTADILHRIRILEERVLLKHQQPRFH